MYTVGTTKSGKAKGRLGQQDVRDMLLEVFNELEAGDIKSTTMGETGSDIQLSPQAKKLFPVSVEVKRRKNLATVYNWMNQADRKDGTQPVVFFRGDRRNWLVFMNADYYMELLTYAKLYKQVVKEETTT